MSILKKDDINRINEGKKVILTLDINNTHYTEARITKKDRNYLIVAKLFSKVPKVMHGKPMQKQISNLNGAENCIKALGYSLYARFGKDGKVRTKSQAKVSKDNFEKLVKSVPGIFDPVEWGVRKNGKYLAKDTVADAVNGMIGTWGRIFDRFGSMDVSEEEMITFRNEEVERILSQNNGNNKKGASKEQILKSLFDRWKYYNEGVQICKRNFSDFEGWPVLALPVGASARIETPELLKVITYERYIKVATLVLKLCQLEVQEAFAGSPEIFCGARVGESTAFQMGKFEFEGELGRYYIDHQVDREGKLTEKLKNEYSYRYVFLNGIMSKIYNLRLSQLRRHLENDKRINDAFLGASYDDIQKPLRKELVSAFLKKLLLLVGVTKEEVALLQESVSSESGDDSDNDVCAHLFRRIFATYAANGGVPTNEVDAVLGHENPLNNRKDFSGWDNAEELIGKLNRCYCFGRLTEIQGNPRYKPVPVRMSEMIRLEGNIGYKITPTCDGHIKLAVETIESEDQIKIHINDLGAESEVGIATHYDTDFERKNRIVISHLPDINDIETWIAEAEEIDISEFTGRHVNYG